MGVISEKINYNTALPQVRLRRDSDFNLTEFLDASEWSKAIMNDLGNGMDVELLSAKRWPWLNKPIRKRNKQGYLIEGESDK